jgi:hypothetical protein
LSKVEIIKTFLSLNYEKQSELAASDTIGSSFTDVCGADERTLIDHGLDVDLFVETPVSEVPSPGYVAGYD